MQLAGDVRRRHDNGEWLLIQLLICGEVAVGQPILVNPPLYSSSIVHLGNLPGRPVCHLGVFYPLFAALRGTFCKDPNLVAASKYNIVPREESTKHLHPTSQSQPRYCLSAIILVATSCRSYKICSHINAPLVARLDRINPMVSLCRNSSCGGTNASYLLLFDPNRDKLASLLFV